MRQMLRMFRNRRFQSIFLSYFRGLIAIVLAFLGTFIAIAGIMYSNSRRMEVSRMVEKDFMRSMDILDVMTETMERDYYSILNDEKLMGVARLTREELDEVTFVTPSYAVLAARELLYFSAGNRMYNSIYLYCARSDTVLSWTGQVAPAEEFPDTFWIEHYNTTDSAEWVRVESVSNKDTISIARVITVDAQPAGIIVFNLEYSYIAHMLKSEDGDISGLSVLATDTGKILYSSEKSRLNMNIDGDSTISELFAQTMASPRVMQAETRRDTILLGYSTGGGYALLSVVEGADYASVRGSMYWLWISGILIAILLTLGLSAFLSLRLYDYVLGLIAVFQSPVGQGAEDNPAPSRRKSELKYIRNNLLDALDSSQSAFSEFTARLSDLRKAQTMALQMQINPHFLLNTLQVVNFSIMRELRSDSDATRIIALLSDILRNNLQTRDYLTRLRDEIIQAQKYLEIESIRGMNSFAVHWSIDPETEDLMVIRCILQPLLENSLIHGLAGSEREQKTLKISSRVQDDILILKVSDNGIGIGPETLEELHRKLESKNLPENMHIGLCNVNMRMLLIFGERAGLTVESRDGDGTEITIRLPVLEPMSDSNK